MSQASIAEVRAAPQRRILHTVANDATDRRGARGGPLARVGERDLQGWRYGLQVLADECGDEPLIHPELARDLPGASSFATAARPRR